MIYISKGIAGKGSKIELVQAARGSQEVHLSDKEAKLWLRGRFSFASAKMPEEECALRHLIRMELAEMEPEDTKDARYWILARCVFCPAKGAKRSFGLPAGEKKLLFWLVHAGIRLTTAELVYLREYKVEAASELLYLGNRQALVETIYAVDTIADNLLENRMAAAGCRDSVVWDILSLLKKKKLLIL